MTATTWVTCPACFVTYAIPDAIYQRGQRDKAKFSIYCPVGHGWHFTGERDVDVQRRRAERAEQRNALLEEQVKAATTAAARAQTRLKTAQRRAAAGTCPCCNRSFVALSRHIATKHPEFRKEAAA